jgi:hypothetical protein
MREKLKLYSDNDDPGSKNSIEDVVEPMIPPSPRSLCLAEPGVRRSFCAGVFGRNLASVAVKVF